MNTKLTWLLTFLLLGSVHPVEAQQAKKVPTVGTSSPASVAALYEAFFQGLRELGYVLGRDILIEHVEGNRGSERYAELVRRKVDVIFAGSTRSAVEAKRVTQTNTYCLCRRFRSCGLGTSG
jgi:hypothetical protein